MKTFKNFIVLILEDSSSNHTLGSLFGKKGLVIEKIKETGEAKRVSDRLDIELRNSLAHFPSKNNLLLRLF